MTKKFANAWPHCPQTVKVSLILISAKDEDDKNITNIVTDPQGGYLYESEDFSSYKNMPVELENGILKFMPTLNDEVGTYNYKLSYEYYFDGASTVLSYSHPELL